MGKQLVVDPNIFNSLVIITLSSFGIAEAAEKAARRAEILERLGLTEDEAKLILG